MINNMVGWFEVPVSDMGRAISFYETVFQIKLERDKIGPLDMAYFPWVEGGGGASGSLVFYPDFYKPTSDKGVVIYFTAVSGDLSNELGRVPEAGGKVLVEKKLIREDIGFMGLFLDSEGNRVALHSRN